MRLAPSDGGCAKENDPATRAPPCGPVNGVMTATASAGAWSSMNKAGRGGRARRAGFFDLNRISIAHCSPGLYDLSLGVTEGRIAKGEAEALRRSAQSP